MNKKGILFIRNVPEEVKKAFKATCARKGESMTLTLIRLMRKHIEESSTANLGDRK